MLWVRGQTRLELKARNVMDMKNFLVMHPRLDSIGGAEKVCFQVIKSLLEHGQKVSLLTLTFDREQFKRVIGEELPKEVKIYDFEGYKGVNPPFSAYKQYWRMVKTYKKHEDEINKDFDCLFDTQQYNPIAHFLFKKADKKVRYIHFPDVHYRYKHSSWGWKLYLYFLRRQLDKGVEGWNLLFCNSNYTKKIVENVWGEFKIPEPVVVYPPVELGDFWCDRPLDDREERVVYVGRFVPVKRHHIMKELALFYPQYEFVSIGVPQEGFEGWFKKFTEDLPPNYHCYQNLPYRELIEILHSSRIYVHLYEGEHFGIAPIEALAAGCVTIPHNSGGTTEFISERFRWNTLNDLKDKIGYWMKSEIWDREREKMWIKIKNLHPERFRDETWNNLAKIM